MKGFPKLAFLSFSLSRGCLEFDSLGSSLSISFPEFFLGDKRTSYNQLLTLNLSIPNMAPANCCHVFVEIVGRFSRYRQVALVAELPPPSNQPQLIEVLYSGKNTTIIK